MYNTLVLPYLNYCNMIWTAASESLLNKLQVLQQKAVRIVSLLCEHTHRPSIQKISIIET